jgi:P-type Ca2+ transporter type 2C
MKNSSPQPVPYWHALSCQQVLSSLQSFPTGLTETEAARRLLKYGPNELEAIRGISPWTILFEQFKNVLIVILLIATAFSALLGHGVEALAITVIVMFAVMLGFIQEYRAECAIEALHRMAAPVATALRDGEEVEIPACNLIPGDVILLQAGDKIPADVRLIETINLQIEEAALTGESVSVEKKASLTLQDDSTLADRRNMAYGGTTATYGRGRGVVVETGMDTEFGKIARMLQTIESGKTPLQKNLDALGRRLAQAAFMVVAVIVALGLMRGQPIIEMLIFGIALAVAVVPEALPAVVTISLAIGVQRMVSRHALMRRLQAVETLGSTSVICSDKTGTLTKDEMTVRKIVVAKEIWDVSGAGYQPDGLFSRDGVVNEPSDLLRDLLRATVLASDAHIIQDDSDQSWKVKGDPTEGALVVSAMKGGIFNPESEYPRVDEIPFTSERKRMTTLHTGPEGVFACSKGAPELILASCTKLVTKEGDMYLDAMGREAILEKACLMATEALRVVAVAIKPDARVETAETEMTFLGLVGMIDPPRPEARGAILTCEGAGIKTVMITGDHPLTAQAVARELGLLKGGRIVTGAELEEMGEAEFEHEVENIDVYARVSPAHKLRVVTALQKKGHIVAMTGDGVNDAPALKKADIGIAMGITGTDVTKEAAAMTLTDDNFASIVAAVEEGRCIFGNIKKYLMYLLSSNIGEIGLMAGASIIGLPLPLTAVQLLYVNLATDGLPALALAVDPPEPELMHRLPRNPRSGIFTRPVIILMLMGGIWSTMVNLSLFAWALESGRSTKEAMTMTFVSLVLIQFFKAYNFRSDRNSVIHQPFANKWLNLAIGWEVILLAFIVYIPILHEPFGTFSLSLVDWTIIVGLTCTVSPVLELAKWMERRGWFGQML